MARFMACDSKSPIVLSRAATSAVTPKVPETRCLNLSSAILSLATSILRRRFVSPAYFSFNCFTACWTSSYSAFGGTPNNRKFSAPSTTVTGGGGGGGTKMLPIVSLIPICMVALGVGRRGLAVNGRGATSAEAVVTSAATAACLLKVGAMRNDGPSPGAGE